MAERKIKLGNGYVWNLTKFANNIATLLVPVAFALLGALFVTIWFI